jgi:hypothetical protein
MPTGKIILRKLKELQTIWHPDSKLVFRSRDEKVVTGMFIDGGFVELDDTAIGLAEEWGFKIDEDLLEIEEVQTSDEEETAEEDEEEVETTEDVEEEEVETNEEVKDDKEEVETTEEVETAEKVAQEPGGEGGTNAELNAVQGMLWKLYIDVSAANYAITEKENSHASELEELRKEISQLKASYDVLLRDRDDKDSKLISLKAMLG